MKILNKSSNTVTEGIRIIVEPEHISLKEIGSDKKNMFMYRVIVSNEGNSWAKLLSRHWIIIDADGNREDVSGDGVVGYQPELKPGDTFTYTSYCPLDTDWGTMEGTYKMIRENGSTFSAEIGRFYLVAEKQIQ